MNDQANYGFAIDAVVGAARVIPGSPDEAAHADTRNAVPPDIRSAMLLSRLLAASPPSGIRCILFVACGGVIDATGVALAATRAAASILGRSLLIDGSLTAMNDSATEGRTGAPVPDAFIPQLYHYRLAQRPVDMALLYGGARRTALNTLAAPFRFVAIDVPAPNIAASASALAPLCIGTVLVVRAGSTTREAIKNAAQHVTTAGGKIIGAVLDHAPAALPRWAGG